MTSGRGSGAVRGRGLAVLLRRGGLRSRDGGRGIRVRRPRPSPRVVIVVIALLALLGGAWLWLRQSSLVAVKRVSVAGASGPDAPQIRLALVSAARDMTTLNVQLGHLRTAVSPYPVVKGLRVTTQFPHGLRIRVIEQVPVAMVQVGGRRTPVAGDGTLLHDVRADLQLPSIALSVPPGGTRLTGVAAAEVRMLAAAPYQLLVKVALAASDPTHGLVAQLRNGPRIYFGGAEALNAKWDAVVAVLAAPGSAGASYIDVTDPSRPAAGVGADASGTATTTAGSSPPPTGRSPTTARTTG